MDGNTLAPDTRTIDFGGIEIDWDPRVLEPRAWTSAQSEWAAELAETAPEGPILELCCGAGQIGLLTARLSGRDLVQVDIDDVAAGYARANADRAGIATDIRLAAMDRALDPAERFPVIVADPPWLPSSLVSTFPDDPITAVDGGGDGLSLVTAAAEVALRHLAPGGDIVFQVGSDDQANYVARALQEGADWAGGVRASVVARRRCSGGVLVHIAGA